MSVCSSCEAACTHEAAVNAAAVTLANAAYAKNQAEVEYAAALAEQPLNPQRIANAALALQNATTAYNAALSAYQMAVQTLTQDGQNLLQAFASLGINLCG